MVTERLMDDRFGLTREDWRLVIVLVPLQCLGYLPLLISPIFIAALISHFGYSETYVGSVLSAEILFLSITSSLFGATINRFNIYKVVLAGGAILIVGNALCVTLPLGIDGLIFFVRIFAGIGAGILLGISIALVTRTSDPDRVYGVVGMFSFILSATALLIISFALNHWGLSGMFVSQIVLVLVLIPLFRILAGSEPVQNLEVNTRQESFISLPFFGTGLMYMTVVLMIGLVSGIGWTYGVLIGQENQLTAASAAYWMGIGFYFAVPGHLIVAILSLKFGRTPLFVSLFVQAGGVWFICCLLAPIYFSMGQVVYMLGYGICIPYMYGTAAALDDEGRWAGISSGVFMFAAVISPIIGAYLIETFPVPIIGYQLITILAVAMLVLKMVTTKIR